MVLCVNQPLSYWTKRGFPLWADAQDSYSGEQRELTVLAEGWTFTSPADTLVTHCVMGTARE
jgi:hypothetical protein